MAMGNTKPEQYFVFMSYDPEYERLRADRTKRGAYELDLYLSKKHDELLANTLEHGTYKKTLSLFIVDGFAVEITEDQVINLHNHSGQCAYICQWSETCGEESRSCIRKLSIWYPN